MTGYLGWLHGRADDAKHQGPHRRQQLIRNRDFASVA
jgi:hypothetical protein